MGTITVYKLLDLCAENSETEKETIVKELNHLEYENSCAKIKNLFLLLINTLFYDRH